MEGERQVYANPGIIIPYNNCMCIEQNHKKIRNIRAIIFDVDGVLTDGRIYLGKETELKSISYKDMDAVSEFRKQGYIAGMITGENGFFIDKINEKLHLDFVRTGCKDKRTAIDEFVNSYKIGPEQICYIGDGKYDIPVFGKVGLTACPGDAIDELKAHADFVLQRSGGDGCIAELFTLFGLSYQF